MAGVILYVENTLISYSEVQAVQNYETHAMSGYIFHMFIWNKILWDGCKKIRNNAVTNGKGVRIFISIRT